MVWSSGLSWAQLPEPLQPCQGSLCRQVLGIHGLPSRLQPNPAGSVTEHLKSGCWLRPWLAQTTSVFSPTLSSHTCPTGLSRTLLWSIPPAPLPLLHPPLSLNYLITPRVMVFSLTATHRLSLISLQSFLPPSPHFSGSPHLTASLALCLSPGTPVLSTALLGWSPNPGLPKPPLALGQAVSCRPSQWSHTWFFWLRWEWLSLQNKDQLYSKARGTTTALHSLSHRPSDLVASQCNKVKWHFRESRSSPSLQCSASSNWADPHLPSQFFIISSWNKCFCWILSSTVWTLLSSNFCT